MDLCGGIEAYAYEPMYGEGELNSDEDSAEENDEETLLDDMYKNRVVLLSMWPYQLTSWSSRS